MPEDSCYDIRYIERIPNNYINELEPIEFRGSTLLIKLHKDDTDYAIAKLSSAKFIGFDTESRPTFIKGQKFPISIIQLALPDEVFIFQVKRNKIKPEFIEILNNPNITKIGIGITEDLRKLKELSADINVKSIIDLSAVAKSKGLTQSSARSLTARYLNKRLIKSSQITNWAKPKLTEKQIRYAATDAWIMFDLYKKLNEDKFNYHKIKESKQMNNEEI